MVTCCFRCNSYKGDKTPQEAGMTLKTKPYEPNIFSHIIDDEIEMIWDSFKKSFY